MNPPLFFYEHPAFGDGDIPLNEETSRHIVQVLRMKTGEALQLTDGKGNLWTTRITGDHKKKTMVMAEGHSQLTPPGRQTAIAISLVKNNSRFEWFLEKATEIGINHIVPLLCERTEKQHFRHDRMKAILISAMLQSRQVWMPELQEPVPFKTFVSSNSYAHKFIAHCEDGIKNNLNNAVQKNGSSLLLIGPEGDFTRKEIDLALANNYTPVTLGNTRLRTETAGIVGATLIRFASMAE